MAYKSSEVNISGCKSISELNLLKSNKLEKRHILVCLSLRQWKEKFKIQEKRKTAHQCVQWLVGLTLWKSYQEYLPMQSNTQCDSNAIIHRN